MLEENIYSLFSVQRT